MRHKCPTWVFHVRDGRSGSDPLPRLRQRSLACHAPDRGVLLLAQETARKTLDIVLVGPRLQVLTAADAKAPHSEIADRQLAVLGVTGQQTLGQLRVGIVGLGGTGSHMAQNLAYLGARDSVS